MRLGLSQVLMSEGVTGISEWLPGERAVVIF